MVATSLEFLEMGDISLEIRTVGLDSVEQHPRLAAVSSIFRSVYRLGLVGIEGNASTSRPEDQAT
jgi:hypothetical protein